MKQQSVQCDFEEMSHNDGMFLLYTSGSTGKPKGILHSTAGYLVHALLSFKLTFDYREDGIFAIIFGFTFSMTQEDIHACVADVGWITGHTYVVYGPLAYGATTFLFEGIPTYPDPDRYWNLVQRNSISQIYISPTAIRTLMKVFL
jgi:acetyl-CoA synthetase